MARKILITGAAGFIGYHLARHLLAKGGSELVLVDNLWRGKHDDDLADLLASNAGRATFLNLDLTDASSYERLPLDVDHVYHLAAVNGTKHFYAYPHEVLRINVLSLAYILEWLKKFEKKPVFLFTSSNEAYAGALEAFDKLPIPTPEEVPLVVSDVYNPRWSYGGSKLIGELFVIHYATAFGVPAHVVRPHNFYGPRAGTDHVIPELFRKIHSKEEPFVLFAPHETRSFCYIGDAVEAMAMLMENKSEPGAELHHIGTTVETNIGELAEAMFRVAGWKPEKIATKESLAGSVKRRLPHVGKIKAAVGWEAKIGLEQGLAETWEWYRDYYKKNPPTGGKRA